MLRLLRLCCLTLAILPLPAAGKPELRIAVVHDVGIEGRQTWRGVTNAVSEHSEGEASRFDVKPEEYRYTGEAQGLKLLLNLVSPPSAEPGSAEGVGGGRAHVVIGPTDSGIFVALGEHRDEIARAKVPIISPLVTADVPNEKASWVFRTNVNVVLRAREVASFLAQRGHGPITVLYEDSEFGKLAEKAFRDFVPQKDERLYKAYVYRGVRDSQSIRTLLQERPWAVGVFGPRQMIEDVHSDLSVLNQSWYSYEPLIFSVVDARAICRSGIFFVSLEAFPRGPCQVNLERGEGEPHGLAFDTTRIALTIAEATRGTPGTDSWQEEFRARFSRALDGREAGLGLLPRIRLAGRENRAPLGVYTVEDRNVVEPNPPASIPARRAIGNWLDVRWRRFGVAPLVNLLLIIVLVGGLTLFDAARWHSGSLSELPRRWPFLRLMAFNLSLALVVFLVLAETETGPFRWDFLFGALVVAFGYQALLKTTILETPSGQRLGLADIYERVLRRMNDRIMVMRFDLVHEKVSFVAQTNSLAFLRDTLHSVYRRAKTQERGEELVRSLDQELTALPEDDRCRLCAERLLALMSWRQLQDLRLVPSGIDERNLIGPDSILRASRDHVLRDAEAAKRLTESLKEWFASLSTEDAARAKQEREDLEQELKTARTDAGRVYRKLQYLFTRWTYDLDRIERAGLIPPAFRMQELERRAAAQRPAILRFWQGVSGWFRPSQGEDGHSAR